MNFDNDFYQEFINIKTKPPVSKEGFDSQWEFLKATSYYHFNPDIEDQRVGTCENPLYIPLANFQGDWSEELDQLIEQSQPWSPTAGYYDPHNTDHQSRRHVFENNDYYRWGYAHNGQDRYIALNRVRKAAIGKFKKIAELFHLEEPYNTRCDIQFPGYCFYYHIDNFGLLLDDQRGDYDRPADCDIDQRKMIRFIMFLTDQDFGHVWHQGNLSLKWKKGDCFAYPWRDMPHGTANFGHSVRAALNVTGVVTDRTLEVLKNFPKVVNVDLL
jgi:hypothetical protein